MGQRFQDKVRDKRQGDSQEWVTDFDGDGRSKNGMGCFKHG